MGESYQVNDQRQAYFCTFQVVGWADFLAEEFIEYWRVSAIAGKKKE